MKGAAVALRKFGGKWGQRVGRKGLDGIVPSNHDLASWEGEGRRRKHKHHSSGSSALHWSASS